MTHSGRCCSLLLLRVDVPVGVDGIRNATAFLHHSTNATLLSLSFLFPYGLPSIPLSCLACVCICVCVGMLHRNHHIYLLILVKCFTLCLCT